MLYPDRKGDYIVAKRSFFTGRERDAKDVRNAVERFNRAVERAAKPAPAQLAQYLPDKLVLGEVKKNIASKDDLENFMRSAAHAAEPDAFTFIPTENGITTKLDVIRAQEGVERVNLARAKRAEEARKEGNIGGTKAQIKRQSLDPISYDPLKKSNKEIKKLLRLVARLDTDADRENKANLYKKNYLQAAEKEMGKAAARALKEAIKDIPPEQVYDAVFDDPILQMDFIYFSEYYEPKMFLDRMLSRWEQYKDVINR